MTFLWGSDLHLDEDRFSSLSMFLKKSFYTSGSIQTPQAFLVTGDIADKGSPISWMPRIRAKSNFPCYFVLGNHDYYGASVSKMRWALSERKDEFFEREIHYVPFHHEGLFLSDNVAVVGVDGWADGRSGDYLTSTVYLRDWDEIHDLMYLTSHERLEAIQEISDQEVSSLLIKLTSLPRNVRKVLIMMHVPPFRESCLWQNTVANDQWAPHFVAHNMGLMLTSFFSKNKSLEGTVLCGHSHHRATYQPLPNLRVETAASFDGEKELLDGISQIEF